MAESALRLLQGRVKLLSELVHGSRLAGECYEPEQPRPSQLHCNSPASSLSKRPSARRRAIPIAVIPLPATYSDLTCFNASSFSTALSSILRAGPSRTSRRLGSDP